MFVQFLHQTGKQIEEKDVYEAMGYPSHDDIQSVIHHLLNSDYQTAHAAISNLCKEKVHPDPSSHKTLVDGRDF